MKSTIYLNNDLVAVIDYAQTPILNGSEIEDLFRKIKSEKGEDFNTDMVIIEYKLRVFRITFYQGKKRLKKDFVIECGQYKCLIDAINKDTSKKRKTTYSEWIS